MATAPDPPESRWHEPFGGIVRNAQGELAHPLGETYNPERVRRSNQHYWAAQHFYETGDKSQLIALGLMPPNS